MKIEKLFSLHGIRKKVSMWQANSTLNTSKLPLVESSLVVYKDNVIQLKRGLPDRVDFDFEMVNYYIKREENFEKEHLHFFHLHPFDTEFYSALDENCAKSLGIAFGFPINFWIATVNNSVSLSQYRYLKGKMELFIQYGNFKLHEGSHLMEREIYKGLTLGMLSKLLIMFGE